MNPLLVGFFGIVALLAVILISIVVLMFLGKWAIALILLLVTLASLILFMIRFKVNLFETEEQQREKRRYRNPELKEDIEVDIDGDEIAAAAKIGTPVTPAKSDAASRRPVCVKCGEHSNPGQKFCRSCGNSL